jgi:hypothetical protein
MSVDELIAQADAICARYATGRRRCGLLSPATTHRRPTGASLNSSRSSQRLCASRLMSWHSLTCRPNLHPPGGENLDRLARSADLLDEGGEAAAAQDRDRFIAMATEARKIELEMAAFAQRVGFSVCGREAVGGGSP